jgi:hypothetical protein
MRRGFILFVGILALALAPAMVSAQYSGAFGLSGLPSMPSMFGGSSKCGERACPAFAPAVYFGWGVPQDRNTSVSLTAQNNGAFNIGEVTIKLPTNGFWLGAALPVSLGDNLSFVATGWYLFPGTPSANSNEDFNPTPHFYLGNNWTPKFNWWFVDGAFAYTFGGPSCGGAAGSSGFSLLLGLRYDYYYVSISDPNNNLLFGGQEAGDVTSNGWIPFVGFQTAYTDTVQSMKVRILGIPTILGNGQVGLTTINGNRFEFTTANYNQGHFFEIFGEYTRKFFGASQAGVFARWNTARATTSGTGEILNANLQDTYNFSLNRSSWTLGGLVTLDFNSPF